MSQPRKRIGCVIVCHGNVAQCLMDAVQGILGRQSGWRTVSNSGLGLAELRDEVSRAVEELAVDHEVVVFSDMPGGSCYHACQECAGEERGGVHTLSGLNLMMLLEFFVKRDRTELTELLALVHERGRDSVRLA
jgi:mannose/fructose-specific phosphotransferase system component IIA